MSPRQTRAAWVVGIAAGVTASPTLSWAGSRDGTPFTGGSRCSFPTAHTTSVPATLVARRLQSRVIPGSPKPNPISRAGQAPPRARLVTRRHDNCQRSETGIRCPTCQAAVESAVTRSRQRRPKNAASLSRKRDVSWHARESRHDPGPETQPRSRHPSATYRPGAAGSSSPHRRHVPREYCQTATAQGDQRSSVRPQALDPAPTSPECKGRVPGAGVTRTFLGGRTRPRRSALPTALRPGRRRAPETATRRRQRASPQS